MTGNEIIGIEQVKGLTNALSNATANIAPWVKSGNNIYNTTGNVSLGANTDLSFGCDSGGNNSPWQVYSDGTNLIINQAVGSTGQISLFNTGMFVGGKINCENVYATFQTNGCGPAGINSWTKFVSLKIMDNYATANAEVHILGGATAVNPYFEQGLLNIRAKQQSPLGQPPFVEMFLYNCNLIQPSQIVGILSSNTSSLTQIDIYIQFSNNYTNYFIQPYNANNTSSNGVWSWLSYQPVISSLPSGTQFSCVYGNGNVNNLSVSGSVTLPTNYYLPSTADQTNWNGKLSSEADPVFSASPAHSVTSGMITVINNTSGTNTGDETQTSIKSKLGITTLSGSNTGDETQSSIQTKLGQASSTQSGYLSTSNWSAFNNKADYSFGSNNFSGTGSITAKNVQPIFQTTGGGSADANNWTLFATAKIVGQYVTLCGQFCILSGVSSVNPRFERSTLNIRCARILCRNGLPDSRHALL